MNSNNTVLPQTVKSKEDLLNECYDLNLPVNRNDSYQTLQLHLQAAYDEVGTKKSSAIDPELEAMEIYIGKMNILEKFKIRKYLPFL